MSGKRLSEEEAALWARVVETVRPLDRSAEDDPPPPKKRPGRAIRRAQLPVEADRTPGTHLDSHWDRRLARGQVEPDRTIDLHGHTLDSAYEFLDRGLESAILAGARVVLLITGHPPRDESPVRRGKIRAAVGDWLGASRHAGHIAAVRGAHQRHGGRGAIYVILRRKR